MNEADHVDDRIETAASAEAAQARGIAGLKPKGACWYCNQPLDNVRRFCSKTCADDYKTEEEAFNSPH